ncbi:cell wall anchor protein, partial [Streptomyces botrytidirepellens]
MVWLRLLSVPCHPVQELSHMPHDNKHRLSRRGLFTLGGGLVAAGALGGGVAALAGGG